jgi:hypothetical protein
VLIALGAVAVAVYALDQAREAKSRAAAAIANPTTVTTPSAAVPSGGPTATPTATASASLTPQFVPDAINRTLVVPATTGCQSSYVDVDTLKVGEFAGHDLYLTSCTASLTLRADTTDAAVSTSANATPEACAVQLAGIRQSGEITFGVFQNLTVCLLTSKAHAGLEGQPQRIGIVKVTNVAADGAVTLSISTYRVPTA